ncbi:Thiamine monophosphate synthase [Pedobacter cryoconitis]|uniref:Thiamine monophosphate synthase n=1 Tax=Pedobacter cryoconitis TaxID=188932 RepID=A0A127VFM8_9SPHI|nr:thiamine phosphate synthase [Pedobacter cryoconitis]AMQ00032.1 Thiamine monophosphate synthase [Pedobacter cryoconitis]
MELIAVTRPDYFQGEGKLINALFEAGLQLLHLRKPENDETRFMRLMLEINPDYYRAISIHQHHELANMFSIRRLHYPEKLWKLTSQQKKTALFAAGFHLSRSVHQWGPPADTAFLDYVFFGPVFNSISKVGYQSIVERNFYLSAVPQGLKVFGIGGVNADLFQELQRMNFDGAAVLGALWNHPSGALKEFEKMLKSLEEKRDVN